MGQVSVHRRDAETRRKPPRRPTATLPCAHVATPPYTPGWNAEEAETRVGCRHRAVPKVDGFNHPLRLRRASIRVSLLPLVHQGKPGSIL
jgi:hypothetical protein